uniref:Uncharacterized protein n=1 Tax=Rhizophora mucronata TaxID=61149 RepID=A0A2P2IWL4_RHIMU
MFQRWTLAVLGKVRGPGFSGEQSGNDGCGFFQGASPATDLRSGQLRG